jgi:hypothetical protein
MTHEEETIVYDAYRSIKEHSKVLAEVVNAMPEGEAKKSAQKAYRNGVYAPAIKLEVILGSEGLTRGELRYREQQRKADEFFGKRPS